VKQSDYVRLQPDEFVDLDALAEVTLFTQHRTQIDAEKIVKVELLPEHSQVRTVRELSSQDVPAGTIGTIVHVYQKGGYEVEFATNQGAKVVTVDVNDVEAING
jgi:hypothetical protein